MNQESEFYELKTQLADLGFSDPEVIDQLRQMVLSGEHSYQDILFKKDIGNELAHFILYFNSDPGEPRRLYNMECALDNLTVPGCQHMQNFQADVPAVTMIELVDLDRRQPRMTRDAFYPLNLAQTQEHIRLLQNHQTMNTQNLSYLQKQLLNLGFGEDMNKDLERNIESQAKEFTIGTTQTYNKQDVNYTLHYKAGEKNQMYFFNKYDASLKEKSDAQTFYINNGSGVTAKEAYNLLEGRAVRKQLVNHEQEQYHAWLVRDTTQPTTAGFKLKPYTDKWNYKPEKAIDVMDIVGIGEPGAREKLMKSLEKGNRHQVTAMKNGKEVQLFIEANPADHRVNLTNYKGEAQQIEDYKKPEFKKEAKQDQKQAEKQTHDGTKKKRTRRPKQAV